MKMLSKKLLAVLLLICMTFGLANFDIAISSAVDSEAVASEQTALSSTNYGVMAFSAPLWAVQVEQAGLTVTNSGANIWDVTGTAVASAPLIVDIPSGTTLNWEAALSSSLDRARYALTLAGGGTLNLNGSVNNTAGGAINITGTGAIVNISGVAFASSASAYAVNINASGVVLNIDAGGFVSNAGTSSSINVTTSAPNASIIVNGGEVIAVPNGNAINDSGGSTQMIIQNGGVVTSGGASAIRSIGTNSNSTVLVSGGTVSNAAANNLNPAIYMDGSGGSIEGTGKNVIVRGTGIVQSTSNAGYALQTRGSVLVSENGKVISINGCAINLIGTNSNAQVTGNASVTAAGSGVAIRTAIDANVDVTNSSVTVNGGTVSSNTGNAIQITGASSKVTVTGGTVSTSGGSGVNAIFAASTVQAADITITGGVVSATYGRAIFAAGPSSNIHVTGGFVFAYGSGGGQVDTITDVISAANFSPSSGITTGAFVITWGRNRMNFETLNDSYHYLQNQNHYYGDDLTNWGGNSTFLWQNHPTLGAGIFYYGATTGFFPIAGVEVITDYGLIFYSDGNIVYRDPAGNAQFSSSSRQFLYGGISSPPKFSVSAGHILNLNDFRWNTDRQYALSVTNDAVINISGSNMFASVGMHAEQTFTAGSYGINIFDGATVTISGTGTMEIRGLVQAFNLGQNSQLILPDVYTYWTSPDSEGISVYPSGNGVPFDVSTFTGQYFKISLAVAIVEDRVIEGEVNAGLTGALGQRQAVITLLGTSLQSALSENVNSWFGNLPAGINVTANGFAGSDFITLTFDGVPTAESNALFDIKIPDGILVGVPNNSDLRVVTNYNARFDIQQGFCELLVFAGEGGTISSIIVGGIAGVITDGKHRNEAIIPSTIINVTAAPDAGYRFVGWDVIGLLDYTNQSSMIFAMPSNRTFLFANFERIVPPPSGGGGGNGTGGQVENVTPPANEENEPNEEERGRGDVSHILNTKEHIQFVRGTGGGNFEPNRNMTRAEVSQMFFNLLLEQNIELTKGFSDVEGGRWYELAVRTLASLEILSGYPDGNFRPQNPITRAEFVAIAIRFARETFEIQQDISFEDVNRGHWAYEYIKLAVYFQWVKGYSDGNFMPNRYISRAEVVTIVNRMLNRVPDRDFITLHLEYARFLDVTESHWAFYDIMEAYHAHQYVVDDNGEVWQE